MAPDIVDQRAVKRILLVTTFRTGSTFLGALLQESDPLTYYHYEPLHFLTFDWHVRSYQMPQARDAVKQLFQCDMEEVFHRIRRSFYRIGVIHLTENKLLMNVCRSHDSNNGVCQKLPVWEEACRRSRVQLMKLTRLDLKDALTLELPPDTKVVYLQRDPRGIYSSRKRRPWCGKRHCRNIDTLCRERESDIAALKNVTPGQVIVLRFEDFANNPMKESKNLFKMLNLEFSPNVKKFIASHTKLPPNGSETISKVRNSKAVAVSWKNYLSTEEIDELQEKCATVFKEAGYELAWNEVLCFRTQLSYVLYSYPSFPIKIPYHTCFVNF